LIQSKVKIHGLADVDKLLRKTLPEKAQRNTVRKIMHVAARPMVKDLKRQYKALGGSGSLALATRSWNVTKGFKGRFKGSIDVGPKRNSLRALKRYFSYYYPNQRIPATRLTTGIRHGHLVEWGTEHSQGRAILKSTSARMFSAVTKEFTRVAGEIIDRESRRFAARQKRPRR